MAKVKAYLHDDEEEECDEDVDLRVSPGVLLAGGLKLLGRSLPAPRAVVKQGDQGLVLRQLTRAQTEEVKGGRRARKRARTFSHLSCHELSEARREGERGHQQGDEGGVDQASDGKGRAAGSGHGCLSRSVHV